MSLPFLHNGSHCRTCQCLHDAVIAADIIDSSVPYCKSHYYEIVLGLTPVNSKPKKKSRLSWREKRKEKRAKKKEGAKA